MKDLIKRTRALFDQGLPLAQQVEGKFRIGPRNVQPRGSAVLDAIESQGYDTLHRRPAISKAKQVTLLGRVLISQLFPTKRDKAFCRGTIYRARVARYRARTAQLRRSIHRPVLRKLPPNRPSRPQQFLLRFLSSSETQA